MRLAIFLITGLFALQSFAQESIIEAPQVGDSAGRSKWGYSFFNLSTVPQTAVIGGAAQIFSYNYISANYYLGRDERVSIRPTFYYSTAGYDDRGQYQAQKTELGDAYLQYTKYNLALLPLEFGLSGSMKLYLPTSEGSKLKHTIAKVGGELIAEKGLGDAWEMSYRLKPDYYLQSQTTYIKTENKTNPKTSEKYTVQRVRSTDYFDIEQSLELKKRLNRKLALGASLGLEDQFDYGSKVEKIDYRRTEDFTFGVSAEVNFARKFSMIFSLENTQSVYRPKEEFKLFRAEETDYTVLTFWSI